MKDKKKVLIIALVAVLAVLVIALIGFSVYDNGRRQELAAKEAEAQAEAEALQAQLDAEAAAKAAEEEAARIAAEEAAAAEAAAAEEAARAPKSTLTNLPLKDPSHAGRRNVAVMIENTKAGLPHSGMDSAGVIYECPMEGALTRIVAVFDEYDGLPQIGNVRSCRPYFAYIAAEYDAIYVHFGQSVQGKAVLDTGLVDNLSGLDGSVNSTFFRTSDRKAPHNAWTSAEGIEKGIEKKNYRKTAKEGATPHFVFAAEENTLPSGSPCEALSLYFQNNTPYFTYNPESKLYSRFEYAMPEKDSVNGAQIAVRNIILQDVPVSQYDGYPYLNIPITGSGKGKFITDGKVTDITWKKASEYDITRYYMPDGTEIELNPGKTWVSLIQNSKTDSNKFYATLDEFNAR